MGALEVLYGSIETLLGVSEEAEMTDMEKWSINESLLQSYRSIFISSQSFPLAVGVPCSPKTNPDGARV